MSEQAPGDPDPSPDNHSTDDNPAGALPGEAEPGGRTIEMAIERELAESYLTYAMSTIVDRALPDVRDGLKPSQRRILVAMNDLNLTPGRKHSKCAGIVGETMKKYHPHGDQAIYPTLVNLAQEWKTRYPLVDKQGNFGSIDPDPPAAMRYTEARLHRHALELLDDLKQETVDWQPNFDEAVDEPKYLPARFPNLLVNGSTGIAVGMASSIPPHNLGEVCDAVLALLDDPMLDTPALMEHVKGPDFPTGGIVCGRAGIYKAYATGRGRVVIRAKLHHEQKKGRNLIVVTEMPYQVSKNAGVVDKIKDHIRADRLTSIANIWDESSNRAGMRLVIELKRAADPDVVENQLYQVTPLQSTFSIHNIALVKGQPRTLTLREMMREHIDHRAQVIRRRTAYKLRQAQQEAHRIEGLIYAVCDIDEVIALIRASRTRDQAIEQLMRRGFRIPPDHPQAPQIPQRLRRASADQDVSLTRVQAEAIGRLQLIQLVGLEIETLVNNYAKLLAQIEEYEDILGDPERVKQMIRDDLTELKTKYADARRTVISAEEVGDVDIADLTPVEQVVVTITHSGYVKRLPTEQYKVQGRGGRGVIGSRARDDDDFTRQVFVASTHDDLLCFTDSGRVFKIKVFQIPQAPRTARGRAIVNLVNLQPGERIREFMPIADFEKGGYYLLFATRRGLVKRTSLKDYRNVNASGLIAVNLREDDALIGVTWSPGGEDVILATAQGMAIRFHEDDARVMGRNAMGVKGIDLAPGDRVIGMIRAPAGDRAFLLTVTDRGYGKRTPTSEYLVRAEDGSTRAQSRGGKGRRDMKLGGRNGEAVAIRRVEPGDHIMLITHGGMIVRTDADSIRHTHRGSQGVKVINLAQNDTLTAIARLPEEEGEEEEEQIAEGENQ